MADFAWNSRRTKRVQFELAASIRLNRSSKKEVRLTTKTITAKLMDLSAGGCAVECIIFVPMGVKIDIFWDRHLLLTADQKETRSRFSRVIGVVKSSRQLTDRKYRLGVQFENISQIDQKLINNFIDKNERREDKRITFDNP